MDVRCTQCGAAVTVRPEARLLQCRYCATPLVVDAEGTLFHEVIRACKAAGLDVAGADVLKLAEELAVKDITALLAFLDLPEDSLSLAAVLRSPLCGWSETKLYDLAQGRAVMDWREANKMHVDFAFDGDFSQIKKLTDHFLLYAKLDLRAEFDFLVDPNRATIGLDEIPNRASPSVLENIQTSVDLVQKSGLDVIVVDITSPDVREAGFFVGPD